jgi:hypothetical protein
MALSPDDKFLFLNADTAIGESDASMYYPIRYLRGLDCPADGAVSFYFRGPNDTTSTRIIVVTTAGFVKEFFLQFVNEINFGEKVVITLASKNTSVSATDGGSDFVYVDATVGAIIFNDDATGFENLQVAEDLDVGGLITATALNLTSDLAVTYGGTGVSSLTDNGVLFGNGAAAISAVDLSANGNIIVGGATPAVVTGANLAGAGLAATVGDGTLVLAVETLNQDTTGTAAIATAVTIADESSDTSCFPLFATAATGDLPPKSGSNLTFNSSSGLLTATLLAGDLTGDVTGNSDTVTNGVYLNVDQEITSKTQINKRQFSSVGASIGDCEGDIIYLGSNAASHVAGNIYTLNSSSQWVVTDADATATSIGLLAVAMGTDVTNGMCIRGMANLNTTFAGSPASGAILYLDDATAGAATGTAPTGNGDIVRVLGYKIGSGSRMWFNPDNTFVEVTA